MAKSLAEMTAEIRDINIEKGWRPAGGGPGTNTFGDYLALLHSEISETLEAYRDHRLADATAPDWENGDDDPEDGPTSRDLPKPEGVGSELADALIRFLDMCDVFGLTFDMDWGLADVAPLDQPTRTESFGDHMTWLHGCVSAIPRAPVVIKEGATFELAYFLRALVTVAERYGIDLTAEYERKVAYNRTRAYRHGGRNL